MKNSYKIIIIIVCILVIWFLFFLLIFFKTTYYIPDKITDLGIPVPVVTVNNNSSAQQAPSPTPTPLIIATPKPSFIELSVPYINEAPDNIWQGPWKNACEEASITMVEKYYQGKNQVTIAEAKEFMTMLFAKQDEIWGSNTDADAERATRIINDYTSFKAVIKENPTLAEIKDQLQKNQPVISLHYGKELYNPNIPFLATGSYYHMMVIIGYDDINQEFITNDDGDIKTGAGHRYDYELFLNSLHDFDFSQRQANGPPRVIFTSPK